MNHPIQFHNDADFMTIKVDNVAIYRNLTSEFQAKRSSISQETPCNLFRQCVFPSKSARAIPKFFHD